MADLEEDQYMDCAAAGADDWESAAPMDARSRCRRSIAAVRRRWHGRCLRSCHPEWRQEQENRQRCTAPRYARSWSSHTLRGRT